MTPVATDVWEGFIFINVDPEPEQTLAEFLGDWGKALSGYGFGSMVMRDHYQAEVDVNWKLALDAFQEAWHARFVHKRSGGEAYASKDNPFIHVLQFKIYPLHRMMSVPGNAEFVRHRFRSAHISSASPTSAATAPGRAASGSQSDAQPDLDVRFQLHLSEFLDLRLRWMFFTYHFWPLAADRMMWRPEHTTRRRRTPGSASAQEYAKCALRDTWLEDLSTLENIQAAISSRSPQQFVLQDQEILVRHSHKVIADFVGE